MVEAFENERLAATVNLEELLVEGGVSPRFPVLHPPVCSYGLLQHWC